MKPLITRYLSRERKAYVLSVILLFVAIFFSNSSSAQCSADAGQDQTICQGESVVIGGSPTAVNPNNAAQVNYSWNNQGSLNNNNTANPTATPNNTTTYTINLSGGGCNGESDQVVVTVLPSPNATINYNPNNSPCADTPINFVGSATSCNSCQYSWNFGDPTSTSNTATGANATHTFNAVGTGTQNYTVTLTVTAANGCTDTQTTTVTIKRIPDPILQDPINDFIQCSGDGTFPLSVFDASTPATNSSYTINWGDASANWTGSSSPQNVTHTYTGNEVFDLVYTVVGSNGCSATETYYVANITNPSIGAANPGGTQGCGPLTICFPLNNYAANHSSTTYVVDFGDGSPTQSLSHPPPAQICHTYTASSCVATGSYVFSITATNLCDQSIATIQPVKIWTPPQASFIATPVPACVNTPVSFTNTSTPGYYGNSCNQNGIYVWDFGDGTPAVTVNGTAGQSHTYTATGSYTVTLTASNGCAVPTVATQVVCVEAPPTVNISTTPTTLCLGQTATMVNTSASPNSCSTVSGWTVTYVDNPCDPDNGAYSYVGGTSSSTPNAQFQFNSVGVYSLTYSMDNACPIAQQTVNITVNTVPVVSLSTVASVCAGTTVSPSATVDGCLLPVTTYAWSFPGGSPATATGANPGAISYATAGNYTMSLTATNACGPTTVTGSIPVLAPPSVSIVSSQTDLTTCYGANLTLTANGAGSYTWTSSAGGALQSSSGTSVIANPTQSVTYTVTGTSGTCTDTETIALTIDPLPVVSPGGTFSMCQGQTEPLSLTVTGGSGTYSSYAWSPATGLSSTTISNPSSSVTSDQTYSVSVTDSHGCVGVGSVFVDVLPLPSTYAGPDIQLCNQPVATQMTGYSPTTGGTGSWSGPNVTTSGAFTPAGVGPVTLQYCFTETATGCSACDNVVVTVINPTVANGGPDFNACLNAPAINLAGPGTWSGCGVTANSFNPSTLGACTLTYTVGNGSCQTSDQVVVTVNPLPTANAGNDVTICLGATVNLGATGTSPNGPINLFTWSGATVSNSTIANPTFTPSSAGVYTLNVTVVDSLSCSDPDQVTVTVNALPTVNAGPDLQLCNQPIATTLVAITPATGGTWSGTGITGTQFTPPGVGSYTATYSYTDPTTTCVNQDQITIQVINAVVADAGPDIQLCQNTPIYTIVPPVAGGTWTPQPNVTAGGIFNPTTTGTFTFTYTIGSGTCLTTDQMQITVNPLPVANAGPDAVICLNNSYQMQGSANGGTPSYSYAWSFGSTLNNPNIANPIASPVLNTNYTLTVTDSKQCTATDQVLITVNGLPVVEAGNNITVCDQQIAETLTGFSATPASGTGTWTGTGITNPSGVFMSPGVGTYWAYYEYTAGGNACSATDSIQITVIPPVIANAGPDVTMCLNDGILTLSGYTPATGATWSGTGVTSATNGIFNPITATVGTWTLTINNGTGTCHTSDQMQVHVVGLPLVDAGPDVTVCGNAAPFDLTGFVPATGGTWEGNGITNASLGSFDPGTGPNTYSVFYWYTDPNTGCADTSFAQVVVSPVPVANFTLATLGCTNAPVDLTNTSTGATQYAWDFGDGHLASNFDPFYTYPAEGIYDVTLIASNNFGCRDTAMNANEIINPPAAAMTTTPADGCAPLNVAFTNNSVGQYLTYFWDVYNETFTTFEPTAQVYQQGPDVVTYPVALTATNFCGSDTDNQIITVYPQPVAGFGTDLDVFCSPFTVNFNNNSTGNPDTFDWDFADNGPHSFVEEPGTHVFFADTIPVDYTIFLYLSNECGVDTANYTITVLPNTVTAFFNTNVTQGCSPLQVEFTDYSDGADQIWYNLGDGTNDSNDNPTHIYSDPGTYCIYQYVDNGCSYDTTQICIEVYASPEVEFTTDVPNICQNSGVQFHDNTADAIELNWDFGDGGTSTNSDPFHTYPTGGVFNVTLTGVGDNGCTSTISHPFTVYDAPDASFTVPDQVGCSPFNICFTNSTTGGFFYQWDFADGNTSNTVNSCNTYYNNTDVPHLYTVTLTVQNMQLCVDSIQMDVIVSPQPTSAFTLSNFESCYFPVDVDASNFSLYANGFEWYQDGNLISDLNAATFTFDEVGDFDVALTASNQFGCEATSHATYTVHPLPNIAFDATPHEGCEDLQVTMINSATGAVSYLWDFGDGTQSTSAAPAHLYTIPGMYDVSLIATTAEGCVDTLTTVDLIGVWQMPYADFYYTPEIQDIYSPTFQFYDMSAFADEYLWQFGDGTQYILPNPEHTYDEAGLYPVTLTVRTNHGCTSTKVGSVTVEDIFQVYVPNTFTPDGDGINEVFLPKMTGIEFIEHYLFRIVDRWGTVIFETEDPNAAWVGDVRDGEYFAKDEGYNWYVIVQLIGVDEDRVYKGHVILVR